jgi:hypothetical protein
MLGFSFRIQDIAQLIESKIGYLVLAFPAQINPCRYLDVKKRGFM